MDADPDARARVSMVGGNAAMSYRQRLMGPGLTDFSLNGKEVPKALLLPLTALICSGRERVPALFAASR